METSPSSFPPSPSLSPHIPLQLPLFPFYLEKGSPPMDINQPQHIKLQQD